MITEHRDVTEDSPKVGRLHGALTLAGHIESLWTHRTFPQYWMKHGSPSSKESHGGRA